MAKFRIAQLAELARQMEFTPADTRLAQLAGAEALLLAIDPAKAYPFEFVVYRITGYRPRKLNPELLTGLALQHDLGLLIERVSDSLDLHTRSLSEPVLQIEDVCERLNVTSKTIQRWRRRGMSARRFIFPDGKRRVGFLLSSVERFLGAHREQVNPAGNFSQVDDTERGNILCRARRMAQSGCCAEEITRRIGRALNRSPLTILHTVRKHDAENPGEAILPRAGESFSEVERTRILKSHRAGATLGELARQARRSRAAIYRVVLEERVARINRRKVKFIDDSLYHQPEASRLIDDLVKAQSIAPPGGREEMRIPRDLPAYFQDLFRTPLLTPARERALFLKFNFHKYQFVQARRRLDPQTARSRELGELEEHLRRITETKNQIVAANLRLVVSVARKHLRPWLSLMELVSEGNLTLLRAVESFDVHKGNRFSTYATFALMKGFARSVPMMRASAQGAAGLEENRLEQLADPARSGVDQTLAVRDELAHLMRRLDSRERDVLLAHYGISSDGSTRAPASYDELGVKLGLSRHRIRQIEQLAMEKLRGSVK